MKPQGPQTKIIISESHQLFFWRESKRSHVTENFEAKFMTKIGGN